jgi:hypothetical protein
MSMIIRLRGDISADTRADLVDAILALQAVAGRSSSCREWQG